MNNEASYDEALYEYDRQNYDPNARLLENAYLYRLTSLSHCGIAEILSGKGPLNSRQPGRFHAPQQQTTYCANNVLVCVAEVLFHMYRSVLDGIKSRQPLAHIRRSLVSERCLVIVRVAEIPDLVY